MSWRAALEFHGGMDDMLSGTAFEPHAARYAFGLHIQQNALPADKCAQWIDAIVNQWPRAKTKVGKGHYISWQIAQFPCTCKYMYAGAKDHQIHAFGKTETNNPCPINAVINSIQA